MGNAEKLRAVLIKQRKKVASAQLYTLLKHAADGISAPAAAVKPTGGAAAAAPAAAYGTQGPSAPSRAALLSKPTAAPGARPPISPALSTQHPEINLARNTGYQQAARLVPAGPSRQPPVAYSSGPTIGAPNTPQAEPPAIQQARANYRALQQQNRQKEWTPAEIQANEEAAARSRYADDPRMRGLALARLRGTLSTPAFQAATKLRPLNVRGTLSQAGQGLQALNSLFGASYRDLYDRMAGGNTEAGETASKLYNAAKSHWYGATHWRNPDAMGAALQRASEGIPETARGKLNELGQEHAALTTDPALAAQQQQYGVNPTQVFADKIKKLQSGVTQFTPAERAEMLQNAETYDSAKQDERELRSRDPLFHGAIENTLSDMGDTGWSLLLPGAAANNLRGASNLIKARGIPRGLFRPMAGYNAAARGSNVLDSLANLTAKTPGSSALQFADDYVFPFINEVATVDRNKGLNRLDTAIAKGVNNTPAINAASPAAPSIDTAQLAPLETSLGTPMAEVGQPAPFRLAANTGEIENQPILDAQGKPTGQTQPVYKMTMQGDDGKMFNTTLPVEAAAAAGLTPYLENKAKLPDINKLNQQAADTVSRNPRAADMKESLNTTGKAPPDTANIAAETLAGLGMDDKQIKALTDWWGEPGNMATALGIGASAIGLMMMFMGGQDGLMSWLMPALGITMTAGGLGTLGYQGTFGKTIQDSIQGAVNPAMKQLGGMAYDAGWMDKKQFWQQAAKHLTPEQLQKLQSNFNIVNKTIDDEVGKWPEFMQPMVRKISPTAESITDEQLLQQMQKIDPEAYKAYMEIPTEQGKADVRKHLRGLEELPLGQLEAASRAQTGDQFVPPSYGAQPVAYQ